MAANLTNKFNLFYATIYKLKLTRKYKELQQVIYSVSYSVKIGQNPRNSRHLLASGTLLSAHARVAVSFDAAESRALFEGFKIR